MSTWNDKQTRGVGSYPRYAAMWFRPAVGLGLWPRSHPTASMASILGGLELGDVQDNMTPARIALIDSQVDATHPNLRNSINTQLAVDLGLETLVGAADIKTKSPADLATDIRARVQDIANGPTKLSSVVHGRHGTAMAGLLAGQPSMEALYRPELLPEHSGPPALSDNEAPMPMPLPFVGMDPFAEIVPIGISANPNPFEVFAALAYAEAVQATLVVMAIDVPTPFAMDNMNYPADFPPDPGGDIPSGLWPASAASDECKSGRYDIDFWHVLSQEFVAVSQRRPVICAAGNRATDSCYPARLANQAGNGIISVGAVNADGKWTTYSPRDVTVSGPSGDGEANDQDYLRLDPFGTNADEDEREPYFDAPAGVVEDLPVQDIVTTDVPGWAGYNASEFERAELGDENGDGVMVTIADFNPMDPEVARYHALLSARGDMPVQMDFASLYCRFNGTSAASAIVGGLVSLAHSLGQVPVGTSPVNFKSALEARVAASATRSVTISDVLGAAADAAV